MRHIFFLMIGFSLLAIKVKGQKADTICVRAKILKIESIDYYKVISGISISDKKNWKILSSLDERNRIIENFNDSAEIKVGETYAFYLERMSRIKNAPDNYFFVNLRGFYYGDIQLLKPGEMPYKALNMQGAKIYMHGENDSCQGRQ